MPARAQALGAAASWWDGFERYKGPLVNERALVFGVPMEQVGPYRRTQEVSCRGLFFLRLRP